MNICELLQHDIFQRAKVVAGQNGLTRTVTSVNIMDAPDIVNFITKGQLLLTNAYAVKENPQELVYIIEKIANNGGAGLFFKAKRFLQEIPAEALAVADHLNFPIIELPLEHSLGEVLNQSLDLVLEKQTKELRYALDMHKQFSHMIMKGKGLAQICNTLSEILACHILLFEEYNDFIAMSKSLTANKNHYIVQEILTIFNGMTEDSMILGELCLLASELPHMKLEVEFHRIETISKSVFLVTIRTLPKNDVVHHTASQTLALEQAINIIEFEWMKRNAVKERSRRYKTEFFIDLMEGLINTENDILIRGKKYLKAADKPCCCVLAKIVNSTKDQYSGKPSIIYDDSIYDLLKRELSKTELLFTLFNKNDLYGLLITLHDGVWKPVHTFQLEHVQQRLYNRYNVALSFGIGRPVEFIHQVHNSYKEAFDSIEAGLSQKKDMFIRKYTTKETEELLRLLPSDTIREYYTSTFNQMLNEDEEEIEELQRTLKVYLESHCSIVEASRKLFMHRNTVIYRINKCEKLMQRDIKESNNGLRIQLALMMKSLLQ
ncbi:PucR family transcriptional regulator [Paenibacillus sp. sgz302251]|uniref:PucR family transcriptional regulator n=1 Tax=Paenibacillus sp. sgz302251 TaxID=3414493 RepID=UPI003C7AE993